MYSSSVSAFSVIRIIDGTARGNRPAATLRIEPMRGTSARISGLMLRRARLLHHGGDSSVGVRVHTMHGLSVPSP
jgi:hypothetical protein